MYKKIIILFCYVYIESCDSAPKQTGIHKLKQDMEIQRKVDSAIAKMDYDRNFDTAGLSTAPVLITEARVIQRDYSNYQDVKLRYKNVSGKTIEAIRFKWYGENAFKEPADMGAGSIYPGFGGGYDDSRLKSGASSSGTWNVLSRSAKKIVLAWPEEVIFEDGTKWVIGNKLTDTNQ